MWSRPLRSDELMHHKYIDKVKSPSGAWRYIYDLAGGNYKRQMNSHTEQSRRAAISEQYHRKKERQYTKDYEINANSSDAYRRAYNKHPSINRMESLKAKENEHTDKATKSFDKAYNHREKAKNAYLKSQHEGREARKNEYMYKHSLVGKYDAGKQVINSTLKKAKKRIDKGKDFLSNLFEPKITVSHDVRLK